MIRAFRGRWATWLGASCFAIVLIASPAGAAVILDNLVGFGGPTTSIEVSLDAPAPLAMAAPGLTNLSQPGWHTTLINPTYALLQGPVLPSGSFIDFDILLAAAPLPTDYFWFDMLIWDGDPLTGTLIGFARAEFLGTNSSGSTSGVCPTTFAPWACDLTLFDRTASGIPVPGIGMLLVAGLFGLQFVRKTRGSE